MALRLFRTIFHRDADLRSSTFVLHRHGENPRFQPYPRPQDERLRLPIHTLLLPQPLRQHPSHRNPYRCHLPHLHHRLHPRLSQKFPRFSHPHVPHPPSLRACHARLTDLSTPPATPPSPRATPCHPACSPPSTSSARGASATRASRARSSPGTATQTPSRARAPRRGACPRCRSFLRRSARRLPARRWAWEGSGLAMTGCLRRLRCSRRGLGRSRARWLWRRHGTRGATAWTRSCLHTKRRANKAKAIQKMPMPMPMMILVMMPASGMAWLGRSRCSTMQPRVSRFRSSASLWRPNRSGSETITSRRT